MLQFDSRTSEQAEDGSPLIVLLHGRGADESDLLSLAPHLPPAVVVAPRAPFAAAPWGYGPGWAWYRYLGDDRPDPESFAASLAELDTLITELPNRLAVRTGPLVLGGFSQGGTLSLAHSLTRPGAAAAVLNFSGFLADHPAVRLTPGSAGHTPVFWGHGTHDPAIPFGLAVRGRDRLRAAGATLEARDYAIGHWIDPQELHDAVDWLATVLGG